LTSCGLPAAWAGQAQWRILQTGFGLGQLFLATWQAWKNDPQRSRLLHFVATEASPACAAELWRAAAEDPDLSALAAQLADQWHGLLPGVHRLSFEDGHVLLTMGIGDAHTMIKSLLKAPSFEADSVYLDGNPRQPNTAIRDAHWLNAVARCCRRGTRLASWTRSHDLIDQLQRCGFELSQRAADAPPSEPLQALFNPGWEPKKAAEPHKPTARLPARCVVIGAGLAGAACAASLARRGWQVTLLDAQEAAASGASALPVGMLAPHVSPDDNGLSRLSRDGLRATWQVAKSKLLAEVDWQASGVLQRRFDASGGLPSHWPQAGEHWSRLATSDETPETPAIPALWHAAGGWIKPKRLVEALLQTPGINQRYGAQVAALKRAPSAGSEGSEASEAAAAPWQVLDANGDCLAEAELLVLAAGFDTAALMRPHRPLPLQAIRGQVAWGAVTHARAMPSFPVNGHGSFVPAFMGDDGKTQWLMGATFERDNPHAEIKDADQQDIFRRLQRLLPDTAEALKSSFDGAQTRAWAGVRCASPDHLPCVGPVDDAKLPGLYVCTAMGSRGLSFAVLCGELLAAWLHAEPLPMDKRLAQSLLASRHVVSE
jgi:tRNA 5-methylaminomethyl-2-thiouridine biosynthesis bifunctional protein